MSDKMRSIIFVIVLCLMCSIILTFGNVALKERQEQNELLDRQLNVLLAAGLMPTEEMGALELQKYYYERISELYISASGGTAPTPDAAHTLHVYTAKNPAAGNVEQVILPFTLSGAWGPISGYLALDAGLETVTGFSVYEHGETAGLGAEIAKEWFQAQWRGKKLYNKNGLFTSIIVAKGAVAPWSNEYDFTVDGISGATATGNAITKGLKEKLLNELVVLQKVDWGRL